MNDYHSIEKAYEEVKRALRYAHRQIRQLNIPKEETVFSMQELYKAKRWMEKKMEEGVSGDYKKGIFTKIAKRFDQ